MVKVRGPQAAHRPNVTSSSTQSTIVHNDAPPDHYYGHGELAKSCARFIGHLFSCPEILPQSTSNPMSPPPTTPPTLTHFIAYALHRTRLHPSVLFRAMTLLHRLKTRFPAARGSSGHRLFLTSYMIAMKVACDDIYSYESWVVVGQGMFELRDVRQMEREMCSYLEWRLNTSSQDLEMVEKELRNIYSHPPPYAHSYNAPPSVGVGGVSSGPEKGMDVTSKHARPTSKASEKVAHRNESKDLRATKAARIRADVEHLEDKAVSVASNNSSVAEVKSVYEELQAWLSLEDNKAPGTEHVSLLMSAALLRSILNDRASDSRTVEQKENS